MEFEKQRTATEAEHEEFRSGMVRMLSNFLTYDIKRQYLEDPKRFENSGKNIYDSDGEAQEEEDAASAGVPGTFDKNPFA